MNNKKLIISLFSLIIGVLLAAGVGVHAQSMGMWKYVSGLLQPIVSTWVIYSPDDFRFDDEILPDGDLCANTQVLKKTAADNWDCAADANTTYSASGTLLDLTGATFSVNEGTLTDTKYCIYTAGTGIVCDSTPAGTGDIIDVGPGCNTGACWTDGVVTTGTDLLVWEGTTADANEFSIIVPADPGADIAITMPTSTGTLVLTSGNVATATALASNPTDCAANQFANTIAASGDLTCAAIADADVPDNITVDLAATATALAANGANCAAGEIALGVDASGAVEGCFEPVEADISDLNHLATDITANIVDFNDIKYNNTLAGNPALAVDECFWIATAGGGGFICEGSTADTAEQIYQFPDVNGADTTNFIVVDDTQVTSIDGTGLSISGGVLNNDITDQVNTLTSGDLCINDGSVINCTVNTATELETALDGINVLLETEIDASSELSALMDDETGSGLLVFGTSPQFTTSFTTVGAFAINPGGALTIGDNGDTLVLNSSDWDISATGVATNMGNFTSDGTIEGVTITEGGNAVYNATETPGGELGGTFASFTIDDSVAVSSWTITTPLFSGAVDFDAGAVNDDDCTGQIGIMWFDDTDNAFEFCNADSGVPSTLAAAAGDIEDVGDCATGAAFTGACGTTLSSNTDLIFDLDEDNNGTESFQILDGADAIVAEILESGLITSLVGFDGIGAIDLDYGSVDITDHTFITDGTGDAEIVLPNDSIGGAELDWGSFTDLGESGAVTWSNLASGELTSEVLIIGTDVKAGTLTDTKLCTWDAAGSQIVCNSSAGAGDVTDVGDCSTGACFTTTGTGNSLYFEGSTADVYELLVTSADLGADYVFTFPDDEIADNDLMLGTGAGTFGYTAVPDCDDPSHLNYDTTAGTFSCGTTDDDVPDAGEVAAGAYAAASIDGDDVNSNIAGRSLTLTAASPDTLDADTELYTDVKCVYWEDPVATDDFNSVWTANGFAATITKMWCESDQTVNMDLQVDDGTPADVNGTDLVCDSTPAEDESMGGDATLADGDRLDFAVTSVSGTPTWASICWTFTYDD